MLNCGLIQDGNSGGWWQFQDAREIFVIEALDKVLPALRQIEERVNGKGLWAAGFISYEAGPAFDPAIRARTPGAGPLLWMGLYPPPQLIQFPVPRPAAVGSPYPWEASVTRRQYGQAIRIGTLPDLMAIDLDRDRGHRRVRL